MKTASSQEYLTRCPICSKEYSQSDFSFVEHERGKGMLHISCSKCKSSLLVLVRSGQFGMANFGIITDLTASEVKSVFARKAISSNQVLEVYESLSKHTGSIKNLVR